MPHQGLYLLGVMALFDPQGGAGVSEGVQPILSYRNRRGLAGIIKGRFLRYYAHRNLDRGKSAVDEVGVGLDLADPVRENKTKITFGHNSFHSRRVFSTSGERRSDLYAIFDLSLPILWEASAR